MNECFHDLKQIRSKTLYFCPLKPNLLYYKSSALSLLSIFNGHYSVYQVLSVWPTTTHCLRPPHPCIPSTSVQAISTSRMEDQDRYLVHLLFLLLPPTVTGDSSRCDWYDPHQRPLWTLNFPLWIGSQEFWSSHSWLHPCSRMLIRKLALSIGSQNVHYGGSVSRL